MTDQVNEAVAWMFEQEEYGEWVTRLSLSREAGEGEGKRNLRPLTHPSRGVVDEATWQCNNCRTRFTATDADWKRGFGRCAPACPSCKAFSQFTYPLGAAGLVDKIERMGFSCEGGPLANCTDWHKAKHALQAAALPAVPDGMVLVPRGELNALLSVVKESTYGSDLGREGRAKVALQNYNDAVAATPPHDQPEGSDND